MIAQPLLHIIDDAVDIAKVQPFFGSQLQLPADTLFGKESRPATLPGVGLRRGGKIVIKIQTKLRLIAPLMQMGNMLAE
jgi:hypothetical protein